MIPRERILRSKLGNSWYELLQYLMEDEEMRKLSKWIAHRRKAFGVEVYPDSADLFNAFLLTPFNEVRVVILGQDPYHTKGNVPFAHGLAFSSNDPAYCPTPLHNILKEVEYSVYNGFQLVKEFNLTHWATQGVFLLNTVLTTEKGKPLAHENKGWEMLSGAALALLADDPRPKVFMLWGRKANDTYDNAIGGKIEDSKHLILRASYPDTEGFFGCDHFQLANEFLAKSYETQIKW